MNRKSPRPEKVEQANRMRALRDSRVCEKALRDFVNDCEQAIFDKSHIDSEFRQVVDSQVLLADIYALMRDRGLSPNHDR